MPRPARDDAGGIAGARHRRRSRWLVVLAALIAAALLYAGFSQVRRSSFAARLPALPDLSSQPEAVRDHLRSANDAALGAPTGAAAVGGLGLAYHADLFYDQAIDCYALAEDLDPRDWRWPYYGALALAARGDQEQHVGALRRVLAIAPDFGPALWRLGEAEFKEGRIDSAAEAWQRASSWSETSASAVVDAPPHNVAIPLSAYARFGLARVELLRQNADGARRILEPLTTGAPGFGAAFRLLGDAYAALGRSAEASRSVSRADRMLPYSSFVDPIVDALARQSRNSTFLLQQAREADFASNAAWHEFLIQRALEFDPTNPDIVFEMGVVRRAQGRNAEALDYFRRFERMVPDEIQGQVQIALCLTDLGRDEEAERLLKATLGRHDDAKIRYNLGVVLMKLGRPSEAAGEYQRAIALDPDSLSARTNLAALLAGEGRLIEALRHLERVVSSEPANARARANLGVVLLKLGRREQAVAEFREALTLDPGEDLARRGLNSAGHD